MDSKCYYFYVLYCRDNSLYAGYTHHLAQRLAAHNNGKGAKYTRVAKRRPAHMIFAQAHRTRSDAMRAEAQFKQLSRSQKERFLAEHGINRLTFDDAMVVDRSRTEDIDIGVGEA